MTDEEIVELFYASDELAIAELEKSHKRLCLSVALKITDILDDTKG